MFQEIRIHAHFNERTGYGIHASRFFPALEKLTKKAEDVKGIVHISLYDTVTASQTDVSYDEPSILYNVWESTEQPAEFIRMLKNYDQLWVPSEWQRAASIAQGIPEEFIKVVPEGVDPDMYKPMEEFQESDTFNFVHVGQWQPRKSTKEIIECWLKAFPADQYPHVRLYLSVDTLFPSDTYKSTEERLQAHGFNDERIIVVHYEDRTAYIRRLQAANCFVSCARSEGWGLPAIEAMACGTPTIVADWSGSTEFATDAIRVRIKELIKPFGIYGNWDVPGKWCEPDWDHLIEQMRDVYEHWGIRKGEALQSSERIRRDFSWDAAAKKAYDVLEDFHKKVHKVDKKPDQMDCDSENIEEKIMAYAKAHGYFIEKMRKQSAIFIVDSHCDSQEKLDTLIETIKQIKRFNYPVLLSSHLPLPANVIEMSDYFIYDKRDILSGDDFPKYWRQDSKGTLEEAHASIPCHALAAVHNVRNSVDFCLGKYDWIYQLPYDTEIDLEDWLKKVSVSTKSVIAIQWESQKDTISGQALAARTEIFDKITPRIPTWEEFAKFYGDDRFCSEKGLYRIVQKEVGLENVDFLNMTVGNRFNQVDKNVWKDDIFDLTFIDGPMLNIVGISDRVYDVTFGEGLDVIYSLSQKVGMWAKPSIKYFKNWEVSAFLNGELKFNSKLDLSGKRVLIVFGSKALGDTIAWMPYVEEFRKKHNCHVICSGWWQEIFDYPEIEYVKPGSVIENVHASYEVGCFDNQLDKNPVNWREVPLQKVASDILGLEYVPIRAKLKSSKEPPTVKEPYVCFAEFSTMQNKMWNRQGAWQKIVDYLNHGNLGYKCVSVSVEPTQLKNVIPHNGQGIQSTIRDIQNCEFYVGLNHGPSWIAYSLGKPTILITGVSEEWNDFKTPYRIAVNKEVCGIGCFNDPSLAINRDWHWCPRGKDYVCTREVTEEMVINTIERLRGDLNASSHDETSLREVPSVNTKRGTRKKGLKGKRGVASSLAECS